MIVQHTGFVVNNRMDLSPQIYSIAPHHLCSPRKIEDVYPTQALFVDLFVKCLFSTIEKSHPSLHCLGFSRISF